MLKLDNAYVWLVWTVVWLNNQIEPVFKSDMRLAMNNYETYVTFDEPNPASVNI